MLLLLRRWRPRPPPPSRPSCLSARLDIGSSSDFRPRRPRRTAASSSSFSPFSAKQLPARGPGGSPGGEPRNQEPPHRGEDREHPAPRGEDRRPRPQGALRLGAVAPQSGGGEAVEEARDGEQRRAQDGRHDREERRAPGRPSSPLPAREARERTRAAAADAASRAASATPSPGEALLTTDPGSDDSGAEATGPRDAWKFAYPAPTENGEVIESLW